MAVLPRIGLSLRPNGDGISDLYLEPGGALATTLDAEAVGQYARQKLMAHRGEWFLNKDVGVPWLRDILGKGYDPVLAEGVIKATILDTDGVTSITSFSARFNQTRRELSAFNIEVMTEYDEEVRL